MTARFTFVLLQPYVGEYGILLHANQHTKTATVHISQRCIYNCYSE